MTSSAPGTAFAVVPSRFVQGSASARPSIGGSAAVVPVATTTALRAVSARRRRRPGARRRGGACSRTSSIPRSSSHGIIPRVVAVVDHLVAPRERGSGVDSPSTQLAHARGRAGPRRGARRDAPAPSTACTRRTSTRPRPAPARRSPPTRSLSASAPGARPRRPGRPRSRSTSNSLLGHRIGYISSMAKARDKLDDYRTKRVSGKTPEPAGEARAPRAKRQRRFVIQEHHARRLHWDLRLERDGVLVSWALPRGVPRDPDQNRLAVHTEDHPLEYIDFHGEIPAGQYGAGTMEIWDRGTYEAEKFEPRQGGAALRGREGERPLRPVPDPGQRLDDPPHGPARGGVGAAAGGARADAGEARADARDDAEAGRSRSLGRPARARVLRPRAPALSTPTARTPAAVPELRGISRALARARRADRRRGRGAFGDDGAPCRERLERRAAARPTKIRRLRRDVPVTWPSTSSPGRGARSTLPYEERRARLEELEPRGRGVADPGLSPRRWASSPRGGLAAGLPGVVAKRLDSPTAPASSARDWRAISAVDVAEVALEERLVRRRPRAPPPARGT